MPGLGTTPDLILKLRLSEAISHFDIGNVKDAHITVCFKLKETACGSALVFLFSYYVVKTRLCVTHQVTCLAWLYEIPFLKSTPESDIWCIFLQIGKLLQEQSCNVCSQT